MVLLPEAGTIALRSHAEALGAPRHVVAAAALAAVAARHAREDDGHGHHHERAQRQNAHGRPPPRGAAPVGGCRAASGRVAEQEGQMRR